MIVSKTVLSLKNVVYLRHSKSYSKKVTGPSIFEKLLLDARDVLKNMIFRLILGEKFGLFCR